MSEGDDFARCVAVLADDAERAGKLEWSDVVRVVTVRGLGDGLAEVVLALRDLGVEVDAPVGIAPDSGRSAGGDAATLPASMRTHAILRAEDEVNLGRRVQLGLKAAETAASLGVDPDPLARALIEDGRQARDALILANVRLVISMVRRYTHRSGDLDFDDLVQEGVKGLHRAAEKFDPEKGFKFSTYASWWIRQSVERAVADTGTLVRLPVHVWEQVRKVETYARSFEVRNGRPARLSEIADGVQEDPARVQALLDWSSPVVHLDASVAAGDGDATLGDFVLVATEPGPEEAVVTSDIAVGLRQRLTEVLDPRSLRIVEARFGFGDQDEATLESIGTDHGISRERVRQLEAKIFKVLREDRDVRALAELVLGRAA
ncbi:sigma-70 family RNA polymerase sigma factor [Micromonospora sp. NPDC047644]|uniref:sigma-70 family RNA polymerase sigma factor n=1 Tax=Micromonospora sp. NPDC047644 TaxID=3157203 RepID=UPI0034554160